MAKSSLSFLSPILCQLGEFGEAENLLRESLAVSRDIDDQWGVPICLNHLGTVATMQGKYAEARQCHLESAALLKDMGDRGQMAIALCHLGEASYALGAFDEAEQAFYEALRLAHEIQAVPVELDVLVGLAAIMRQAGEKPGRVCELLGLIQHHPASTGAAKDRAKHLLAELEPRFPAQARAARERAPARTFEAIVEELLRAPQEHRIVAD